VISWSSQPLRRQLSRPRRLTPAHVSDLILRRTGRHRRHHVDQELHCSSSNYRARDTAHVA
jgi:hypothetical protein